MVKALRECCIGEMPASVVVPRVVVPFRKVTVPVGVPAAELTVAVSVTALPTTAEFALGLSVIVGVALFTISELVAVAVA
jgi:hypothetical protein